MTEADRSAAAARAGSRPLIIGIGNPSRGDDALGPALLALLAADGCSAELMELYQLQPEQALDLAGRPAVLIVDAVLPASREADGAADGVQLQRLQPGPDLSWSSHALAPAALLQLCTELCDPAAVPPVWLLGIAAEQFELGAPLSAAACWRLDRAVVLAQQWLAAQG